MWEGLWCAWFVSSSLLTSGQAAVGATQVDVAFWDGCHAELVVGAGEKGSKSASKYNVPLPGSTSHGNTDLRKEFFCFLVPTVYKSTRAITFLCQITHTHAWSQKDHPEGQISVAQTIFDSFFGPKTPLSRKSVRRVFFKAQELIFPYGWNQWHTSSYK